MSFVNIVVISNKKSVNNMAIFNSLKCPVAHKTVVCRAAGFGNARNLAALRFGMSGLMVQFNDDLVLSPQIWEWLAGLKRGEFAFVKSVDHVCSRVFAMHLEDFWNLGGFDVNLKYYFEDGEFYYRAVAAGLRFRCVPDGYVKHIDHVHALYKPNMAKLPKISSEVARVFVKYKMRVFMRFSDFFVPFRDYRVVLQHFVLRSVFLIYWIVKGVN